MNSKSILWSVTNYAEVNVNYSEKRFDPAHSWGGDTTFSLHWFPRMFRNILPTTTANMHWLVFIRTFGIKDKIYLSKNIALDHLRKQGTYAKFMKMNYQAAFTEVIQEFACLAFLLQENHRSNWVEDSWYYTVLRNKVRDSYPPKAQDNTEENLSTKNFLTHQAGSWRDAVFPKLWGLLDNPPGFSMLYLPWA